MRTKWSRKYGIQFAYRCQFHTYIDAHAYILSLLVLKELAFLAEDAVMYKLVGPALIKQTKAEVASTVSERLKWVNSEMCVVS
jgi:hypothetical protein